MTEPKFKPLHISKGFQSFYFIFDADNCSVADFQHCTLKDETQEAYAHLFAAAPEMYEMLSSILNDCGICVHTVLLDSYTTPYQRIKAVLRKARGESEVEE